MIKKVLIPKNFANHPKQLAIIMPVYNEEKYLGQVVEEWVDLAIKNAGLLILINDGSRDGSWQVIQDYCQKYPEHILGVDKYNSGHGTSCLFGYQFACTLELEWIFQTDSDGQTTTADFDNFWLAKNKYDFIFGRRFFREDGNFRKVVSNGLSFIIYLIFRINVVDANVPYRLMKRERLQQLLPQMPMNLYLANAYLSIFIEKKFSIHWLPIQFKRRLGGEPSVKALKFINVGLKVVKEFWNHKNIIYHS